MRRRNVGLKTGFITANVNGHNWIYNLWKINKDPDYPLTEATTYDNKENLPQEYLKNLEDVKRRSPSIYIFE